VGENGNIAIRQFSPSPSLPKISYPGGEPAKRANDAAWSKRYLKIKFNFVGNEPKNQLNL